MSEPKKPTLLSKLKRRLGPKAVGLEETLDTVIEEHAGEEGAPTLDGDARSMMRNVIGFADMRVNDLMVPRANIIAVDQEKTMRELLAEFIEAGHSRLPIFRESLDDIAGMVHVKDFLRWMTVRGKRKKTKTSPDAGLELPAKELSSSLKQHNSLLRDVLFVPPSMPAPDLLIKMKASHIHLAIVVDEYGGTDGLVSLEDLVEVIIGDISDEHDTDEEADLFDKIDDVTYMANGQVEISKLEQELHRELLAPERKDEADTLAGLVFEMAGRVPIRGEIIKHPAGLEFEIVESDARRIKRVRIHAPLPTPESAAEESAGG
ncbi:hemolysin family protein [Aestuariivirga litoralis]|uniref:hemolysin family protein n=1 Tax=Aestuariivirga litoralis TaxID=2650924 RepID=UPI0018C6F261|nr:hemolysin family protein [Aestuariivirga litoralis]